MDDLLAKIYKNAKTLIKYYPYPTHGFNSGLIAETSGFNEDTDYQLKNFVCLMVALGATLAGYHVDNKTAVALDIEGIDYLIYACQYDGTYSLCKEVNTEGIKIYQTIY